MRRWVSIGSAAALLLTASAAVAEPAPEITCAQTTTAFGVRLNEEALALDEIYVDGVVPVPVSFGLQRGLTTIEEWAELVTRGLVRLDVADASGTALAGSVEIAGGWLIWVGEKAFEKNATYELAYSFANDQISLCPEGIAQSGLIRFSTGQRSAAEDLADVRIDAAQLNAYGAGEGGCCEVRDPPSVVPSYTPCVATGKCVACWNAMVQVRTAAAIASTAAPFSYFKIDFSLLAGDRRQAVTSQNLGDVTFAVTDVAPQYCFQADLRPRGPVDAKTSVIKCLNSDTFLPSAIRLGFTGLPVDACVEDARLAHLPRQGTLLEARFGSSEEEARSPATEPIRLNPADDVARESCAIDNRAGSSGSGWLLVLLVMASLLLRRATSNAPNLT